MKRFLPLLLLLLSAAACRDGVVEPAATPVSPTAPEERPVVKIALFGATSGGSALPARRALQGALLAFDEANDAGDLPFDIEEVASDTQEDATHTAELLEEVSADDSYLGAIVWESPVESGVLADAAADGLPIISTSPAGVARGIYATLVPSDRFQANLAVRHIASSGVNKACVSADSLPRGASLASMVKDGLKERGIKVPLYSLELPEQSDYTGLTTGVMQEGCRILYWGGGGTEGGVIASELAEAGGEVALIGADPMIGEPFLIAAGGSGEGTFATCSCVDVSIETDLDAQRFVQDYQSKFGNPPSAYAVEGWDAAQVFIGALQSGITNRVEAEAFISSSTRFGGLGGDYAWDGDHGPRAFATLFEVQNQDWAWLGTGSRK